MIYSIENQELCVSFTTMGGALTSIKDNNGVEYLWQGDKQYWSGQSPVLFPICGSLRNDEAVTEAGEHLSMPRHGIVRKEEFQLEFIEQTSICFSITSHEDMLKKYPYRFTLYILYTLERKSIRVTYKVQNHNAVKMPFFIGGHPGFNCPLDANESYSEYQLVFEKEEDGTVPEPITETGLIDMSHRKQVLQNEQVLPLKHELFHKDAIILDQLKSRKVKLCHKKLKKGVEIDFKDFPYLILWSSNNDGPFIALEPWSGLSTCSDEDDVFEHKRNINFVEPGEMKQLSFSITIL